MERGTAEARRTILLVEDERAVRTFATRVLRRAGYRVVTADSGDAALATFERYQDEIGLVVTDVLMPGMSGAELADRLRAQRDDVAVMFVSGYPADIATGQRLVPHGGALLPKPFTAAQLVDRVTQALDRPV